MKIIKEEIDESQVFYRGAPRRSETQNRWERYEVEDEEEIVRNFLSTKAYTKAGMDDSQREEFIRNMVHNIKFSQVVIDGDVFHILGNTMFNSNDEYVNPKDPDKVIQKGIRSLGGTVNVSDAGRKAFQSLDAARLVPLKYIKLSNDGKRASLSLGRTGKKSDDEIQQALFDVGVYHPDEYDRSDSGNTLAIWEPDDIEGETVRDFVDRMKDYDDAWVRMGAKRGKPAPRNESKQKIKLTKTRLMEIIKEEARVFLESQYDRGRGYYDVDDPTHQALLRRRERLKAQDAAKKAEKEREAADAKARSKNRAVGDELYDIVWDEFDPDLDLKTNINTILQFIDDELPEVKAGLDGDFGPGTTKQGVLDIVKDLKGIREVLNPKGKQANE
tara:strand:- start:1864 stop:3024 length:1161 start_codon:yes stop_codon:yes gene_type:complete